MSKAGPKSSATPKKKTNRDKVNDEIIKIKRKNSGGNKLPLILAVVGVLLLVVVGGLLFFLGGNDNKTPSPVSQGPRILPGVTQNQEPVTPPGEVEARAKIAQLLAKLDNEADRAAAQKDLQALLKSAPEAQIKLLIPELRNKARAGNQHARDLLREASRLGDHPLAQTLALRALEEIGDTATTSTTLHEPTNLLPADSQAVFVVSVKRLLSSGFERGLFTFGAFRFADFETKLGLTLGNIEKVAIGANKEHGHALAIIRTAEPFDWDEVKTKLHIDGNEQKTSRGKAFYLGKVDFLAEFLGEPMPALTSLRNQAAIYKMDARTLVYGDEATVKDLIDNPPSAPKTETKPQPAATAPAPANNTPGGSITPPPPGTDPGRSQGSGAGAGVEAVGINPGGDAPAPQPGGGSRGAGGEKPAEPVSNVPKFYARLNGRLRQVIEAAENGQEPLGLFADSSVPGRLGKRSSPILQVIFLKELPTLQMDRVEMLAVALPALDSASSNPTLRGALLCRDRRDSETVRLEVEKLLTAAQGRLRELFGFAFQVGTPTETAASNTNPTSVNPGTSPGGTGLPGLGGPGGPSGPAPTPQPQQPQPQQGTGLSSAGAGAGGGGAGGSGFGRGNPNRQPPVGSGLPQGQPNLTQGSDPAKEAEKGPRGQIDISRADELVIVMVTVFNRRDDFFEGKIGEFIVKLRGDSETASGKLRVGDLSQGTVLFRNSLSAAGDGFVSPLGLARRAANPGRGPRPYPPNDCVSWMPSLLPYLPGDRYQNLASEADLTASWRDPKNLAVGRIVVSPFLNGGGPNAKSYVRVRGMDQPLAVTDFVGMAGVGPDAAYYDKSDRRAGIFGYYRQTKLEDIKDGTENTIYMIQSDSSVTGPWIAGGGSTIRGTSESGARDVGVPGGFSSPAHGGKGGVWILMADGSARYLTKDVSPEVFKALCTMNGGDNHGELDLLAPKQKLEVTPLSPSQQQNAGKPAAPAKPRSTIKDDD